MKFSEEFGKRKFTGLTQKEAYLKACKWYASNVIAKDEMHNVLVSFEKDKHSPTVTLHLMVALDQETIKERHCTICKEMHSSFFINEDYQCNRCRMQGFQNRMEKSIANLIAFYKSLLSKMI